MEEGVDQPGEDEPGPQDQGNADDQAAEEGQGVQGSPHLIDMLPPARADLPAHDDGGGVADGEDGHGTEILMLPARARAARIWPSPSMWPMMTL